MSIKFKRVGPGKYMHEQSGLNIWREYEGIGAGRFVTFWRVFIWIGSGRQVFAKCDSYSEARAAAITHIESEEASTYVPPVPRICSECGESMDDSQFHCQACEEHLDGAEICEMCGTQA